MNPFYQQLFNAARNTAGRTVRGLDVQMLRNMGPSIRRATGLGSFSTGPITAAARQDPSFLRAVPSMVLATPGAKTSLGLAGAGVTADAANKTGLTGGIQNALNQVGPGLDRFFGAITPKPIQEFGREMEQYGWGALGGIVPGEKTSVAPAKRPEGYSTYGTYTVGGIEYDINSGRPTYMPPGSVYPSSSVAPLKTPAGERAYQQEMSRVTQLTAQDPEFQRYENARKAAKSQEEMNAVRDMGMQMWQEKYKDTPMARPGGAVGFFNPLMQKTFGYQTGMSPADLAQTITNPSLVPVAPGEAPIQTGDLGTRALLETGYDPAAFGITPEQIEEMKLKLLQQSKNQ